MSSLRGKITLGYFLVAAVVLALGVLQMAVLGVIERRIAAGEMVADLLQDSLEMRRYEKKYFLSRDEADLQSALTGVDHAIARVRESRELFVRLTSPEELAQLGDSLQTYRSLLALYETASRNEREDISERARAAGHAASQTAKMLSRRDRDDLTSTVQRSVTVMIAFYLPVVALVLVGGRALSARVIWPLRELEARLKPIAEGRYRHLALPTLDREIVSFARAFNGMLGELQARQDQLRHSERLASLGTLVSGVAHELNNPLGNISASTQLLLEGTAAEGSAQCRTWLERIDSETERARGIVRTLLDYARKGPLRPRHNECVALEEILVDARASAAPVAPLRVTLDLPLEIVLVADEERLRRAFINLMKNALDAGGPDSAVRVSARPTTWAASPPAAAAWAVGSEALAQAGEEPLVRICFDDEGPGIDPEILPRIFDPFFTTHEAGYGTGLGLYIVQEIIQEHGGAVAAENRPGGGARFTLWLPTRCGRQAPGEGPEPMVDARSLPGGGA
jgi:signal transduction histidine kinase